MSYTWLSCMCTQLVLVLSSSIVLISLNSCLSCLVSILSKSILLLTFSWFITKALRKRLNNESLSSFKKAVLVTGCDSGFGHYLALKLNEHGFRVYATVLDPLSESSQQLTSNARFTGMTKVFKMDVTNDDEVHKINDQIESDLNSNGEELWAVVNNAGIGATGHLDWGSINSYQNVIDVNTLGTVRVSRAFLPLIRKSKGRIVNVASLAGRLTDPMFTSYCMSKHAVISFSDSLRREMHKWGVKVATIEPAFYKTNIVSDKTIKQSMDKEWKESSDEVKRVYGQQYFEELRTIMSDQTNIPYHTVGDDISEVIYAIIDAIRSPQPDISYKVISDCKTQLLCNLVQYLPIQCLDQLISLRDKRMPKPLLTQ